jgi:hypothetical protein
MLCFQNQHFSKILCFRCYYAHRRFYFLSFTIYILLYITVPASWLIADSSGRGFAAARLLRLCVRNPPGAWVCVSCECLCCQVEVSATGWSLVQRSPTECLCVTECDHEASIMRRPWPTGGCCAIGKNAWLIRNIGIKDTKIQLQRKAVAPSSYGKTQAKGVREQGAGEDIAAYDGHSNRGLTRPHYKALTDLHCSSNIIWVLK